MYILESFFVTLGYYVYPAKALIEVHEWIFLLFLSVVLFHKSEEVSQNASNGEIMQTIGRHSKQVELTQPLSLFPLFFSFRSLFFYSYSFTLFYQLVNRHVDRMSESKGRSPLQFH